jgi:hypothetical protein
MKPAKRVKTSMIKEMVSQVQAGWSSAKKQRPTEDAVSMAHVFDPVSRKFLVAIKFPSGRSFSCEVAELQGVYWWLIHLSDQICDPKDIGSLADVIKHFARECGDPDIRSMVKMCFGSEIVGRPCPC